MKLSPAEAKIHEQSDSAHAWSERDLVQLDPDHPMWVNQAPRGEIEDLRPYNVTLDITGADIYPVGYPPGTHSLDRSSASTKTAGAMVGPRTRTAMWVPSTTSKP